MPGRQPTVDQISFPRRPEKALHPLLSRLAAMAGTNGVPREFAESNTDQYVYNLFFDIKDERYTVNEITKGSCAATTKQAIEDIEDFLNNKHYLIFNDGVSPDEIEMVRTALKRNEVGSRYFEDSKLRINNITVCLNSMQTIIDSFSKTLGEETSKELIRLMGWEKLTRNAAKNTQRVWKKETHGNIPSSLPENSANPWNDIYDMYHQIVEHSQTLAETGKTSKPTVTLYGKDIELSEEDIEEIFSLVLLDRSYSPNNIDYKIHFLKDIQLGVIPNAQRILACLEIIIDMTENKSGLIGNSVELAEEIAERVQRKFDYLGKRPGFQFDLGLCQ